MPRARGWLVLGVVLLCGSACPPRPMAGRRGCVRQIDCLGGERCDTDTGRCVVEAAVDGGACSATLPGCADDALDNRSPQCATPVAPGAFEHPDLLLCPQVTDHFLVSVPSGGVVEVLAWPDVAASIELSATADPPGSGVALSPSPVPAPTALAHFVAGPMVSTTYVVAVSASTNANYQLAIHSGLRCLVDADCTSGRCHLLLPDVGANPMTSGALAHGGVCVDDVASPCGDAQPGANTRTAAPPLTLNTGSATVDTCLQDVDFHAITVTANAANITLRLSCSSPSPAFLPHVLMVDEAGAVEWAVLFADWQSGAALSRTLFHLPGGTGAHLVELRQAAGRLEGSCTLAVDATAADCLTAGDCTGHGENVRMGRTQCVAGACLRP